jgi:hypothetical protein
MAIANASGAIPVGDQQRHPHTNKSETWASVLFPRALLESNSSDKADGGWPKSDPDLRPRPPGT